MESVLILLLSLFVFIFSSSSPFGAGAADEDIISTRAPHGVLNQTPLTLSPSKAADFFRHNHQQQLPTADDVTKQPCPKPSGGPGCSTTPLPVAAAVATEMQQQQQPRGGGGGGAVGIVLGVAVAVCLAMSGVYYVVTTRRANVNKANNVSLQTHHV
ncbi:hypothetical protein LINGRAHAP2_LOCUS19901 [Linum grandiflorum]